MPAISIPMRPKNRNPLKLKDKGRDTINGKWKRVLRDRKTEKVHSQNLAVTGYRKNDGE